MSDDVMHDLIMETMKYGFSILSLEDPLEPKVLSFDDFYKDRPEYDSMKYYLSEGYGCHMKLTDEGKFKKEPLT